MELRSSEIVNYLSALHRPDCTLSNLSRDHRPMTQSIAIAVTEEGLPLISLIPLLNETPPIGDVDTPNITLSSDGSSSDSSVCGSDTNSQSSQNDNSANDLLKNIRIKNVNRLIIGTLNINFIAPKFEQLKEVIGNHLDNFHQFWFFV